jgi:hypothetical protein
MKNIDPQAIKDAIDTATWVSMPGPRDAEAYRGTAPGAVFTVVAFSIEEQGFPPGSLGYDGAAALSLGMVVRLTRVQAERAVKLARATI